MLLFSQYSSRDNTLEKFILFTINVYVGIMYEKIKGEKFTLDLYSGKIPLLKTLLIVKLSKLSSFRATSAFRVTWSEQHHLGQDNNHNNNNDNNNK